MTHEHERERERERNRDSIPDGLLRLIFALLCILACVHSAHASVTLVISPTGSPTPATSYIRADIVHCSNPTILNGSSVVPRSRRFPMSGQTSITVTLEDNVSQISCDGNQLSYYTFTYVIGTTQTLLKSVELPAGGPYNLANLAPVLTAPFNPGVVQGPQGETGPVGPPGCVIGTTCTDILTPSNLGGALYANQFFGADIGAQVNAAIATFPNGCGEVIIPRGTYTQTTTITVPRCTNLHGQSALGTILNWTATTGVAMVATDAQGDGNYPVGQIADLSLVGTGMTNSAKALYVGGDPAGVISPSTSYGDHRSFNRVRLFGFGTGVQYGNNAFMDTFLESIISNNGTGVSFPLGLADSGESMNFIRTSVQNSNLGLSLLGYSDFFFYASTCDYNLVCGNVNTAHFFGEHFEQRFGPILTIPTGTPQPSVQIYGGTMLLTGEAGSTSPSMISVQSTTNPTLIVQGTQLQADHTVTNVVNVAALGSNTLVSLRDLPYYAAFNITSLLNIPCNFYGCTILDGQGTNIVNGMNYKLDLAGNLTAATVKANAGATLGHRSGFGSVTGTSGSGLALEGMPGDTTPVYKTGTTLNAFGNDVVVKSLAYGSDAANPIKTYYGTTVPSGACVNGSTYVNTSGGAQATTYDCDNSVWLKRNSILIMGPASGTCTPNGYVSGYANGAAIHIATCN